MNLIFLSNFYNHHQGPLCRALAAQSGVSFRFLACGTISLERRAMWGESRDLPDFVVRPRTPADWVVASHEILAADAGSVGSAPQILLRERLREGKLILRFQERPLKNGLAPLKFLPRMIKWHRWNPSNKPVYLLCASAYAAGDYAKMGLFRGKSYKWGYFPETIRYPSIDDLIDRKAKATILWCGRFLDWKHPDDVIEVAKRLHEAGCCFKIEMIGTGEMERQLKQQASDAGLLDDIVRFLGAMSPEAVRRHMESAGIYLFTSDRQEGWGAVLNEAMNSGCAVVASDAAGATPYLVNDGVNGSVYHSGNIQELYEKVRRLLENTTMQYSFGIAAYLTITELWNAEVAAKRFLQLSQALLNGTDASGLFANGPCSLAKPLREDWYQR